MATVVKMQQEIFKFVKRAAFPMHATIPQSPVPIPIPSTNPPLPSTSPPVPQSPLRSSSCHACVNLRGAQLIFCKCLETHFWTSEGSWKGSGQGWAGQNSAPGLCFINCAQVQRAACSACNREARSAVWLITKKLAVVVDFMLNYLSKETTTKTLPQPQPQQRDWRLPLSCPVSAAAHPSKQSLLLPPSPAPQCRPQLQLSPQIYGCHLNFYEFLNADLL